MRDKPQVRWTTLFNTYDNTYRISCILKVGRRKFGRAIRITEETFANFGIERIMAIVRDRFAGMLERTMRQYFNEYYESLPQLYEQLFSLAMPGTSFNDVNVHYMSTPKQLRQHLRQQKIDEEFNKIMAPVIKELRRKEKEDDRCLKKLMECVK